MRRKQESASTKKPAKGDRAARLGDQLGLFTPTATAAATRSPATSTVGIPDATTGPRRKRGGR